MALDLFSSLDLLGGPATQEGYFDAAHLQSLFRSKISKSQATGKDGLRISRFHEMLAEEAKLIERKVARQEYRFTPFKERLILRGADREPRQISIPTVRDRLALRALCQLIHSYVPDTLGSTPHSLVKRVVEAIREGEQEGRSFVRVDVRNFFPSISHAILAREIKHFKLGGVASSLCMEAVQTPTGTRQGPNERGVPQGLSVSGALSALFMLRFDVLQQSRTPRYYRYVDDILVICETKSAEVVLNSLSRSLKARGLQAHPVGSAGKTEIKPVEKGVDFLGYRICPGEVSIRESSYKKMFTNLLKVVTDLRYRKDWRRALFRLNLKITGCIVDGKRRGWMMFFSHTENIFQLHYLDKFLFGQLVRIGVSEDRARQVARFVKAYHEIRFNLASTAYVPNFDTYNEAKKAAVIAVLSGKQEAEVLAWDATRIEEEFIRLLSHEIHDLEKDVGNPS